MRIKIPTVKFHPAWKVTNWKPDCWSARNLGQVRYDRLAKILESPIERAFWSNGYKPLSTLGQFTPQVIIRPYRVDFALTNIPGVPLLKVVIELYGHEFHSTPQQRNNDTERIRKLQKLRWQVITFTGSQINSDVRGCVRETADLVRGFRELFRRLR